MSSTSGIPEFSEGRLAKIRSHVVSRASCAVVATRARSRRAARRARRGLQSRRARAAREEPQRPRGAARGGARRALPRARVRDIEPAVVDAFASADRLRADAPTSTTRRSCRRRSRAPAGRSSTPCSSAEGPPHERHFTCAAVVDGEELGTGEGGSKKAAEQEAAREALVLLGLAQQRAVQRLRRGARCVAELVAKQHAQPLVRVQRLWRRCPRRRAPPSGFASPTRGRARGRLSSRPDRTAAVSAVPPMPSDAAP